MQKLIFSDAFDFGEPAAKLVPLHSKGADSGFIQKRASCFKDDLTDFKREPGYAYIHLISLGGAETYGPNRNFDWFNKEAGEHVCVKPCKERHVVYDLPADEVSGRPARHVDCMLPAGKKVMQLDGGLDKYHNLTFTKMASVYRSHANKHKKGKELGKIVKAAMNDEMSRGELLIGVPEDLWRDDLQKLAEEKPIYFSMAADMHHDTCTYCHNQARTKQEYCDCILEHPGMMTKEGMQVAMISDSPYFHDISRVARPADVIAFGLRKVASANGAVLSTELAELYGLGLPVSVLNFTLSKKASDRKLLICKLAKLQKEILMSAEAPEKLAFSDEAGSEPQLARISMHEPRELFGELKNKKVLLPIHSFYKVVMGPGFEQVEKHIPEAKKSLPGVFEREGEDLEDMVEDGNYEPGAPSHDINLKGDIDSLVPGHSVKPDHAARRVVKAVASGKKSEEKPLEKSASLAGQYLAREYAKYVLSFADGLDDSELRLTAARTVV